MHAALNSLGVRVVCGAAIVLASVFAPAQSRSDNATPTPTPSASPPVAPSPSPTPKLKTYGTVTLYENYLGQVVAHAGPREGYTLPVVELQRLGARTIGDALRFVPGVLVRQTGTAGALQTVALRGNSASQTLILLDGRPVNEGDTGVTDFTSMPLDGVQNIVVIEGGMSSRYGSGAIGGVVEISTKHPFSPPRDSAYAQVGYQGEFGSGAHVSSSGTNGGVVVDAFTRYSNNTFDYPSFDGLAGGTRTNNDLHASDITLCACFHFFANGRGLAADLHLEDNTSEVGAPGSVQFGPSFVSEFARQQRDVDRNSLNLRYSTAHALTTAIFYVDGRRLHFYDPTPSFPYDTLTLATQRGFSVEQLFLLGWNNRLTAKYEQNGTVALFQGTIDTPMQLVARDSTTDLYVGDEYRAGDRGPRIEGAVQFAHTQGTPSTTLPSIAASQQVGGVEGLYGTLVRASYARSFRAPNLDELYFPGFGNPKLQPEYASTFDAGIVTNNKGVDASATVFGSDTNNLIVNQSIDMLGDFLPFNVGRARVRGFSVQVSNAWSLRLGAQASYTGYPVAKDLSTAPDINGVATTGNRLLYRPTATATLEIWRRAGYDPHEQAIGEDGLDLLFVGRQYADEENLHLLPPYATVGLHVSRNLSPHLNLLLRIDNLTDERVPQVYGYPILGTTFSVRLTAK
jgi:vitamin B12 transporter